MQQWERREPEFATVRKESFRNGRLIVLTLSIIHTTIAAAAFSGKICAHNSVHTHHVEKKRLEVFRKRASCGPGENERRNWCRGGEVPPCERRQWEAARRCAKSVADEEVTIYSSRRRKRFRRHETPLQYLMPPTAQDSSLFLHHPLRSIAMPQKKERGRTICYRLYRGFKVSP